MGWKRTLDEGNCLVESDFGLLNSDRLGKIAWEVNVKPLGDGKPIRHQLERNDIEKALQGIDCAGHLDALRLGGGKFIIAHGADDNGPSFASNNCDSHLALDQFYRASQHTLLESIERFCKDIVPGQNHNNGKFLVH
jgi:hypothetical protein